MSKFVVDKSTITKKVLSIINTDYAQSDVEVALFRWWKNIRKGGGLQLTVEGDTKFIEAGLEHHDFNYPYNHRIYVFDMHLNHFMPCPYYIEVTGKSKLFRVYDGRVAVMINLHGDVLKYVDSLKVKRNG